MELELARNRLELQSMMILYHPLLKSQSQLNPYNIRNGEAKYPKTIPYEMDSLIVDLLEFSSQLLVHGGRLVYWLPTITDEYTPQDIPSHPSLRLVSNSEQVFASWSRRLITMEKRPNDSVSNHDRKSPAHYEFRTKYFNKA